MLITKFAHACVRVEHAGSTVVVDPGLLTELESVDGAGAVLVTHAHGDHFTAEHLRRADAPIFTIAEVAAAITEQAPDLAERITVVAPEERFTAAGIEVRTVGEKHAVIHADMPQIDNSGYLLTVDGSTLYHPGDALTLPGEDVDITFMPISGPWLKHAEAIDFARAVKAPRNIAIHDGMHSEFGLGFSDNLFTNFLGASELTYTRILPGADLSL